MTPAQIHELNAIVAQHGLDMVLRDLAHMLADSVGNLSEELQTAILSNAHDIHKAADSITYRAYTGRDLYRHDYEEAR